METIIFKFLENQEKYVATLTGIIFMMIFIVIILSIISAKTFFDKQKDNNQF